MPVVVSTNTRNLQAQLIEKDLRVPRRCAPTAAFCACRAEGTFELRLPAAGRDPAGAKPFELERPELRHFALRCLGVASPTATLTPLPSRAPRMPRSNPNSPLTAEEVPARLPVRTPLLSAEARARAAVRGSVIANHALCIANRNHCTARRPIPDRL
jgi:hypothetical protein